MEILEELLHDTSPAKTTKSPKIYNKEQIIKYVLIVKEYAEIYVDLLEKFLQKTDISMNLLEYDSVLEFTQDFNSNFKLQAMEKFRSKKLSQEQIDKLHELDLNSLKDFNTVKSQLEKGSFIYQNLKGIELTDEEIIFHTLISILIRGLNDAFELYARLFSISKFLEKNGILMQIKKLVYLVGINDMNKLFATKHTLRNAFTLEQIFHYMISLETKRDKEGKRGCPFVLYEKKIVESYLSTIDSFFEKVYSNFNRKEIEFRDYLGFKIFFNTYYYEKETLLTYPFVKEK